MKPSILVFFLFVTFMTFAQQKEKQKQVYRKPFIFSIGFNSTEFYEGEYTDTVLSEQGNSMLHYSKSEGFSKPAYGFNIGVSKNMNEHFQAGINLGFSRILNERYSVIENVYFQVIPISLTATYDFWKDKKQLVKPFVTLKGGYTYMNYKNGFGDTIKGGLNYGIDFGFYLDSKQLKWFKNIHYTLGYHAFFTKKYDKITMPSNVYEFYYNTKREGLTFGINYNFEQKKKRKKQKKKH